MTSDYPFGIFKLFFHWNFQTWCPYQNIELFSTPFIVMFFVVFSTKLDLPRGARVAEWVRSLDLTTHTSLSPIRRVFAPGFVKLQKGCTRRAAASNIVYQVLAHGQWFSPGTPASSTTKTDRHDSWNIAVSGIKHNKSNQIKSNQTICAYSICYKTILRFSFTRFKHLQIIRKLY
jgi:hypothetical protein